MGKNNIRKAALALAGILALQGVAAEQTLTFKIRGFEESEWQDTKTLTEGNSQVNISFLRYTFQKATNIWVEGQMHEAFPYIKLSDGTNEGSGTAENNINFSSYILIEIPQGKDPVTQVEVIGYAHGASNEFDICSLTEAYSTTTSETASFRLTSPVSSYNPWAGEIYVMGAPADAASNAYSHTYTAGRDDNFDGVNDPIPANTAEELKQIRFIRLNWSSAEFASLPSSMGRGRPLALFGLNIYTDKAGVSTATEEVQAQQLSVSQQGKLLTFNKEADVEVFSLNGTKVKSGNNITALSTGGLEQGIYILRATDKEKNTITRKIACH
ncbi:MAG: T9SS type A sorting domain-containing protein [Candidatus Azobacteroides sp.]|nr:T9SS type A sorting domain-containing protein [Candidatus Azobacteroides sp.]